MTCVPKVPDIALHVARDDCTLEFIKAECN
ncbi:hypothetical protein PPL_01963 [Heterostelium album PN500]|uniref:Uncharacterized protein n=1 Tax=Heterostelium pallidum (strain ATCC 26659 / Pp 5 / PN500) TaxID=670386 RepID=D3B0Z5_HETP5|nr:hypothetical protein PPL_01963 [Heterostelium album PN500]EFA84969.1 hypothetical protein PPL_01963 [Heterostelium album PN500]|eukprot:XP_020437079.1 hypothetical protein PPL_01963 [Heterostelium album PN500]